MCAFNFFVVVVSATKKEFASSPVDFFIEQGKFHFFNLKPTFHTDKLTNYNNYIYI